MGLCLVWSPLADLYAEMHKLLQGSRQVPAQNDTSNLRRICYTTTQNNMIKIDPEFKELIPALSNEERTQLEQNVLRDGIRDPLVVWRNQEDGEDILVDGHNRYEIAMANSLDFDVTEMEFPDRDSVMVWIIRNQFGRRNITLTSRCELAEKLAEALRPIAKENQKAHGNTAPGRKNTSANIGKSDPINTREQAAKEAGVSHGSLAAFRYLKDNAEPEELAALKADPNAKLHKVVKTVKERKQKAARQEKRTEAARDARLDERIIVGDFREHADKIPDGSLSLIFTDPPYDREASKMLPALAEFAERKLAEGGSLICYVGQTQLLAATDALRVKLRYWWSIACVHAGRSTVMREYGINAGWKPVLWFVKGTRDDNSIMVNDVMSGGEEKTHHDWQQSQSEAEYWIEKLCPKDGIVCDPFLGGGTTGAAAEKLMRQWVGFEINPENAQIASKRIAQ